MFDGHQGSSIIATFLQHSKYRQWLERPSSIFPMLVLLFNTPSNRINIINGYRAIINIINDGYRGSAGLVDALDDMDGNH